VPFQFFDSPQLAFDSVTLGSRTSYFESLSALTYDPFNHKYTFRLTADDGGGSPPLPVGSGEVMRLYFMVNASAPAGATFVIDTLSTPYEANVTSIYASYNPAVFTGSVSTRAWQRGDLNHDGALDISDLIFLVEYSFGDGEPPDPFELADVNGDGSVDITDLTYLVDYMFGDGPPPVQ
jgi:hypothetical protein